MVKPNRNTKTKERRQGLDEVAEAIEFMLHERVWEFEQRELEEIQKALDCYHGQTCAECQNIPNSESEI